MTGAEKNWKHWIVDGHENEFSVSVCTDKETHLLQGQLLAKRLEWLFDHC